MSDTEWDDTYDDDEELEPQKKNPLREQLRRLESENKALKKRLDSSRGGKLEEIFKAKNVSLKYAKHFPKDQDVTEDTVAKFLAEEFDIALTPVEAAPPAGEDTGPALDSDDIQGLQAIQKAQAGAQSPTKGQDFASTLQKFVDANDEKGFWQYMNSQNMALGPNYE